MADEQLKNYVLQRADADTAVSEHARLAVLAALEGADDLAEVLGNQDTSPELLKSLTTIEEHSPEPIGAYLSSITVQGFRGIGPQVTVPLQPGPGLIVIAGRNGSGKSTISEALEIALTQQNSRWKDKGPVWSQNWRNLHAGEPAAIRIGITEEGSGNTTIGVDWPAGSDVRVDELNTWMQRDGQKRESASALGWDTALELYRPVLSYDELGGILEGKPSQFYDQLYKLLGLEQLTEAISRLDAEVQLLKRPDADLRKARDALKPVLEAHEDHRAATALIQLTKRKPDLDAVRPLITHGASSVPSAWQQAERITTPAVDEVEEMCAALRFAAVTEREEIQRTDTLAADRAKLLEKGLAFHDRHGEQRCPVCGRGTLDEHWAMAARAALEQDQRAVQALTAARAATKQARTALVGLVREVPAPPSMDDGLTALPSARAAHERFSKLPVDGDLALADHVAESLATLQTSYAALRTEAAELIRAREDAWSPVALLLADWLSKAELAAAATPTLAVATEAMKWLQGNAGQLRNERIAPLAVKAKAIWAALRQESNVDLDAIRLEGQKTSRRVVLTADVDGSETEAFGVMSQGELQALALAIFIPRATSEQSPFRFVILDDPIQAMDPSKIDGFLEVLVSLAKDRQVVVLTHDDRLPAVIRRSRAPARIIEITRGMNSTVSVAESSWPAERLLKDAFAIAADEAVPDTIKNAAIPLLCREALEVTAWDVFSSRALAQGRSLDETEREWLDATSTRKRLSLALALNPNDAAAIDRWRSGGRARRSTMTVATQGIHDGVEDYRSVVNDARLATGDLAGMAS